MKFKIDTKEKFTVISPLQFHLSDNITAELVETAKACMKSDIKNVVLNMKHVISMDIEAATKFITLQQSFYESNASFVICEIQSSILSVLETLELTEILNITPTESEAWDIVQMEEIERDLMHGFEGE
jgi:anti-anti-sigma regulatory factor